MKGNCGVTEIVWYSRNTCIVCEIVTIDFVYKHALNYCENIELIRTSTAFKNPLIHVTITHGKSLSQLVLRACMLGM